MHTPASAPEGRPFDVVARADYVAVKGAVQTWKCLLSDASAVVAI